MAEPRPAEALQFTPGQQPSASDVIAARLAAGLTQTQAAESVYLSHYKRWCDYERGIARMDAARFELFLLKYRLHPHLRLAR